VAAPATASSLVLGAAVDLIRGKTELIADVEVSATLRCPRRRS
jgi:hypothetical protein